MFPARADATMARSVRMERLYDAQAEAAGGLIVTGHRAHVAWTVSVAVAWLALACVGKDPELADHDHPAAVNPDAAGASATDANATDASVTDGSVSTDAASEAGLKCEAPPHCSSAATACETFTLPPGAVLDFDACTIGVVGGAPLTSVPDGLGGKSYNGAGTFCGKSRLRGGPAVVIDEDAGGFTLSGGTTSWGNGNLAVVAVALYEDVGAPNQVLFQSNESVAPYRGPGLLTRYAYAAPGWDGTTLPALGPASPLVGAQLSFGVAPGAGGAEAQTLQSPADVSCAPHVFRLSWIGNVLTFAIDGLKLGSRYTGPLDLGTSGVFVGNSPGKGQRFRGEIGQIVAIQPNQASEVEALESALMTRWHIAR